MKKYNDSWDQIIEIKVQVRKDIDNDEILDIKDITIDPNVIKLQLGVEWYNIKWEGYEPPFYWRFNIWTTDRIYFPVEYKGGSGFYAENVYAKSISRNPSDNNDYHQLGGDLGDECCSRFLR